jgi:hypothetical protein
VRRLTQRQREHVIEAMADLGSDGAGRGGARAWLRQQARRYPRTYLRMFFDCARSEVARDELIKSGRFDDATSAS